LFKFLFKLSEGVAPFKSPPIKSPQSIRIDLDILYQAPIAAVTQKKTLGRWLEEAIKSEHLFGHQGQVVSPLIIALIRHPRHWLSLFLLVLTFPFVGTTMLVESKMPFVRVKRRGQKVYYYLVESKREGNKVRQRIIRYLGTKPPTEEELENILKEVNR